MAITVVRVAWCDRWRHYRGGVLSAPRQTLKPRRHQNLNARPCTSPHQSDSCQYFKEAGRESFFLILNKDCVCMMELRYTFL